jgi:hypothetical protein
MYLSWPAAMIRAEALVKAASTGWEMKFRMAPRRSRPSPSLIAPTIRASSSTSWM